MARNESLGPVVRDACAGCGEETATGSVFYSDRRRIKMQDGSLSFICTLCDQRVAASRRGKPMTDEELRQSIETGSLAMISGNTAGRLLRGY
jgi:hypothetical protein